MFEAVLVANRGEIAVRICRTLRTMGIRSVVVASIPDRHSLAVRMADDWVLLEGYSAAESYLDIDAVIAAAKAKGCEAIHPGYGFLSERTDFAERCAEEGIVFIGPPPAVLAGMGDKASARKLAVANGVPVVPGWDGADDDATLRREAEGIGYPVMVKARGGGGGRGMREVMRAGDLLEALASARAEALAAFGDGGLLLEKLVQRAHHVEVQVIADGYGNVVHLGERDCSVQRRHQKLVEETPSPVVDHSLRAELTSAALRLARAIGYVNAGTFEFLVAEPGPDGARPFYFLEVNPRLQVEHPVTEMVTGLDLVELQVRIAAGEALPFTQEEVTFNGHAIEFRINAEDPWAGFKPSGGRIRSLTQGVQRFDSGFDAGDTVASQYDSLLAKAIVFGEDRDAAIRSAGEGLAACTALGLATNIELLREVVASDAFRVGDASIDWLGASLSSLLASGGAPRNAWLAAAVALTIGSASRAVPQATGARWVGAGGAAVWLDDGARSGEVHLAPDSPGQGKVRLGDEWTRYRMREEGPWLRMLVGADAQELAITRDGVARGDIRIFDGRGGRAQAWTFRLVPPPPLPRRARVATEGATAITAPLAGTVASVRVAEGDTVGVGQVLVTLDAMKMEHRVLAPGAGQVKRLPVKAGDVVTEGEVLVELA